VRSVSPASAPLAGAGADDPSVHLALWFWVVVVAEVLWKGLQVAAHVTMQYAIWAVGWLWKAVEVLGRAGLELAGYAWTGLRKAWELLKLTYDNVLKPGWLKLWTWIDRARRWLTDLFGPILEFLGTVKTTILDFYAKWIRPILDIIGVSRQVLRVLSGLGVDWAKRLDAELARIEAAIDRPFRLLVAEINKLVGWIDRIVTADGLFQRLTLIRSIERDLREIHRGLTAWRSKELTKADIERLQKKANARTEAERIRDAKDVLERGAGRFGGLVSEMTEQARKNLAA